MLLVVATVTAAAPAGATEPSCKKSIWGPVQVNGISRFPSPRARGGLLQMSVAWSKTAPRRPQNTTDPADPAYRWPAEIDVAIAEGARRGRSVSIVPNGAPGWPTAGATRRMLPIAREIRRLRRCLAPLSGRSPLDDLGEPSKVSRFQPLVPAIGRRLSVAQRRGPRRYARILDAPSVRSSVSAGAASWDRATTAAPEAVRPTVWMVKAGATG